MMLVMSILLHLVHQMDQPNAQWFNNLRSEQGALCCSGNDGVTVADPDWETKGGHYRVRIEGEWLEVPDSAIVTVPNIDGRTIVWPLKGYMGTTIRCFMPGALG
jgi:hypothetical protein